MSPNLIKFLPKSLTSLRLCSLEPSDPWFDYNTGNRLDSVSEHPEYSTHENCVTNSFDWKDSSLPPTLTCVELTNTFQLGDEFLADQHLPNLLELRLTQSKNFTDSSVPLLSPHLTTLDLRSSSEISGKSFRFLPRRLISLDLKRSKSIFDDDIKHLPRTLTSIDFSHAIHLTDLCIPDLPPHLAELNILYNTQITPSAFPLFPYPFRSSQLLKQATFAHWKIIQGVVSIHRK